MNKPSTELALQKHCGVVQTEVQAGAQKIWILSIMPRSLRRESGYVINLSRTLSSRK